MRKSREHPRAPSGLLMSEREPSIYQDVWCDDGTLRAETKALLCVEIVRGLLPEANESEIEERALELMWQPIEGLLATYRLALMTPRS